MGEFRQYKRKQIAELRPWCQGDAMDRVSVSIADREASAPKTKREAKSAVKAENREPKGKRGPDSELTKAKKRIAAAKRRGKEPTVEDMHTVALSQAAE